MDIHYQSLVEVADHIRRRTISATEVTRLLLARIERYEPRLNSIATLLADSALTQAKQADAEIAAGLYRGPLHGVPIGIKDIVWTQDAPTAAGMELLKDLRPKEDATIVKRLKQAGAVIIAKLQMTEGATVNHHPSVPRPVNPWSAAHWTGVSSSGSGVATAAGFCFGAIGSDTGGSIRMPSSANNLTGIKPTWGRVSRHGLMHLSESLDHLGPMARSCEDAAVILQAIAGADPLDATALADPVPDYLEQTDGDLSQLVLGIDWRFAAGGLSHEIVQCLHDALAVFVDCGMRVREVRMPWGEDEFNGMIPIFGAEVAHAHGPRFRGNEDRYGPYLKGLLTAATRDIDPATLASAYLLRERYKGRIRALFRDIDLLLVPGLGQVLPTWDEIEAATSGDIPFHPDLIRFTLPFNMAGVPTLSLPGGFSAAGLPIGIQLVGTWGAEATLIRAGCAHQRRTHFHTRHPPMD